MATQVDFLMAKMRAFQLTFEKLDSKTKAGHVPIQLAENFNGLLAEIAKESPAAAPQLPKPVSIDSQFRMVGVCDISYATLDVFVGQVLGVLEVLRPGS
jgi:hypothetical protein